MFFGRYPAGTYISTVSYLVHNSIMPQSQEDIQHEPVIGSIDLERSISRASSVTDIGQPEVASLGGSKKSEIVVQKLEVDGEKPNYVSLTLLFLNVN